MCGLAYGYDWKPWFLSDYTIYLPWTISKTSFCTLDIVYSGRLSWKQNVQNSCGMWVLVWFKNHGYIRWTSQSIQIMNSLIVVHVCKRYLGTRSLTSPQIKWCNQQQWRFNPSGWQSIYIAIASEPVWQRIHDTSGPFSYWMLGFHHIVGRYCPLGSWLSSPASP